MLRSVMIPADFSDEFALTVRFATGLGSLGVRRVVLGHVVEASGMEGPIIASKIDKARDEIRGRAEDLAQTGLDVEVRIMTGDPVQQLMALAAETHVDAVVLGTHGKSKLTKFISGSVSERIAAETSVPALLVRFDLLRMHVDPAELARTFGRSVILPTDFSASSVRALIAALELPPPAIGTLYLTHVIDKSLSDLKLKAAEEGAGFQLANQRAIVETHEATARCVVRQGDALQVVLQEANERRATGIIVGTRGKNMLQEAVLGSTSMTLIRQASCPVMIVP